MRLTKRQRRGLIPAAMHRLLPLKDLQGFAGQRHILLFKKTGHESDSSRICCCPGMGCLGYSDNFVEFLCDLW